MSKHLKNKVYSPQLWSAEDGTSLFLTYKFCKVFKRQLESFENAKRLLLETYRLFDSSRLVRPVECCRTQTVLRNLQEPIQLIFELFEDPFYLPNSVISYRYNFLLSLCDVNEQISQVNELINSFHPICLDSSDRAFEKQQFIESRLGGILQLSEAIELNVRSLIEEM